MALNTFEVSALAGLEGFARFTKDHKVHSTRDYYLREENPSEKLPNKYQKRHQIHVPLTNVVSLFCRKHGQPKKKDPIVYYFSSGVLSNLLKGASGLETVTDILEQKENSNTYVTFKMKQFDFLVDANLRYKEFMAFKGPYSLEIIKKQVELMKNVFVDNRSFLNVSEKDDFKKAGAKVDLKKTDFSGNIISPSTQQGQQGLLFLP